MSAGEVCNACIAARDRGLVACEHHQQLIQPGRYSFTAEVHKPSHYQLPGHPEIECIDVCEALELDLLLGSAFQYIWRAGRKGDGAKTLIDLKKAQWYLSRKIAALEKVTQWKDR